MSRDTIRDRAPLFLVADDLDGEPTVVQDAPIARPRTNTHPIGSRARRLVLSGGAASGLVIPPPARKV